jgi:Kef-type K+ transport system membrane component KefB
MALFDFTFNLSIVTQFAILLFVALISYIVFTKIKQSVIIGEILLGILIGPSILGLVTYTPFIQSIATLGAILLLFVIGFEFKLKDIYNIRFGIIAAIGVVVPFISGFYFAQFLSYDFTTSFFIATTLTATSIAITANVLKELGKLQTEPARAIIGAAVIDDVLGLIVLSFAIQVQAGDLSIIEIGKILAAVVAFFAIAIIVGRPVVRWIMEHFEQTEMAKKHVEILIILAFVIAFIFSAAAEQIGLSAIVGAFLAGITMEGVRVREDFRKGADHVQMIFAPIFFISLGILIDFNKLTTDVIWFVLALTAIAFLTKLFGCYFGARIGKMNHRDSLIVGIGMVPRGEVAMIVALIGLEAAVITQEVYTAVILMSLLTTLFVPAILRYMKFPTDYKS